MKVILLKQKHKLGKVGEIVTVKDGYGRNYLIPQGVAVRATAANEEMITERKGELEKHNTEVKKTAEVVSAKIAGKDFAFIRQCADDGRLFGSVSAKDIAQILSEKTNMEIIHSNIFLQHPIKSIGVHDVVISLHAEVTCNILINVARSESEAKDAISSFKSDAAKEAPSKQDVDNSIVEETTPAA